MLSRTLLALVAEVNYQSSASIGRLLLVSAPVWISIHQIVMMHDFMYAKNDIVDILYSGFRIALLFGQAWAAPSAFATGINNTFSLQLYLIATRSASAFTHLLFSVMIKKSRVKLLTKSLLQIVPAILYILAAISNNSKISDTQFVIGVCLDFVLALGQHISDSLFERRMRNLEFLQQLVPQRRTEMFDLSVTMKIHLLKITARWRFIVLVLIFISAADIYPYRQDSSYPSFLIAIGFTFSQYVYGLFALLFIIALGTIYKSTAEICCVAGDYSKCGTLNTKDVILWADWSIIVGFVTSIVHLPVCIVVLFCVGTLRNLLFEIYSNSGTFSYNYSTKPLNLSVPVNFELNYIDPSLPNSLYLKSALSQLNTTMETGTSRLDYGWKSSPMFLCSSGLFMVFISILKIVWTSEHLDYEGLKNFRPIINRWGTFQMLVGVLLMITATFPVTWIPEAALTSASLLFLLIAFGSSMN
jgi:hypothetical protein